MSPITLVFGGILLIFYLAMFVMRNNLRSQAWYTNGLWGFVIVVTSQMFPVFFKNTVRVGLFFEYVGLIWVLIAVIYGGIGNDKPVHKAETKIVAAMEKMGIKKPPQAQDDEDAS